MPSLSGDKRLWRVCEASSIRQRQHPLAGVSELPAGAAHEPQEQISSKAVTNISSRAARRNEGRKMSGAAGNRRRTPANSEEGGGAAKKRQRGGGGVAAEPGNGVPKKESAECPHQRKRSTCNECGGGSICPHQRERSSGARQRCPREGIRRVPTPAQKEHMQGVWGLEHLPAPAHKEHM